MNPDYPPAVASISGAPLAEPAPVTPEERIATLDVLRGAAVLGILLINILDFGLPPQAYGDPSAAGGATGASLGYWFVNQILFEGKMRAIFSMLFGASAALLIARGEERGAGLRVADIYLRRTLWLILFGVLHAYFIWWGDILYFYGIVGLMLFPLRRASPKWLLAAGVLLVLISSAKSVWGDYDNLKLRDKATVAHRLETQGKPLTDAQKDDIKNWDEKWNQLKGLGAEQTKMIAAHRGSYWQLFLWRWKKVSEFQSVWMYQYGFYDTAGMMLIGMGLLLLGVLSGARSTRFYAGLVCFGYLAGGAATALAGWYFYRSGFNPVEGHMAVSLTYDLGRFGVALGHIGLLILLVKLCWLRVLTVRLAACGRMALSCYLATSVICTTIFYGYGFGLYGRLQRYELLYVVLAVWVFLLIVSPIWLRHFSYGPMEWVWRSLTYWRRQPMQHSAAENILQPIPAATSGP